MGTLEACNDSQRKQNAGGLGTRKRKYGGDDAMKFVSKEKRTCVQCNKEFQPVSNRQKTCSKECQDERERSEALRRYYERKDGSFKSQVENTGVGLYRSALSNITSCMRCGSTKFLVTHHKDGNRKNNSLDNLEKICKRCHQLEHNCKSNLPSPEECGKKRSEYIRNHPEIFREDGKFRSIIKV